MLSIGSGPIRVCSTVLDYWGRQFRKIAFSLVSAYAERLVSGDRGLAWKFSGRPERDKFAFLTVNTSDRFIPSRIDCHYRLSPFYVHLVIDVLAKGSGTLLHRYVLPQTEYKYSFSVPSNTVAYDLLIRAFTDHGQAGKVEYVTVYVSYYGE